LSDTPTIYPLLIALFLAALLIAITVAHGAYTLPSIVDTTDPLAKFYALSNSGHMILLVPLIPFLVIPAMI
jgi:hypothetical protein